MEGLSYSLLRWQGYEDYLLEKAPEKILQFGEGNFMRAFCDYFVDILNQKCGFNGKIVVCQPIANGLSSVLNEQQGLYTLYLRGFEAGQRIEHKRIVSSISRCINPYENYQGLLDCTHNTALRYIFSNTTEAGIVYDASCRYEDAPPTSFPAKLTRLLHERYCAGLPGFVILSCELIDNNGAALQRCVEQYIAQWGLEDVFARWVEQENLFCSTLVDRIVTGYPKDEADALDAANGYRDRLLVTGEVFGSWVIEGPDSLRKELPFEQAGLPVLITDCHTPYKQRKVRILNGAHTAMVAAAYLGGMEIVRDCMEDGVVAAFLKKAIFEEIIPTLTLPREELLYFAHSVEERFRNPFVDHSLLSIALNSTSKWRTRVLPSVKGYLERFAEPPACLALSMAAYLVLYGGDMRNGQRYTIIDDQFVLDFFAVHKKDKPVALTQAVLQNRQFWGEDLTLLSGFAEAVTRYLAHILDKGAYETLKSVL